MLRVAKGQKFGLDFCPVVPAMDWASLDGKIGRIQKRELQPATFEGCMLEHKTVLHY